MNLPDFLKQDRHGYIHLTGHRIGLRHIVDMYNDASTPEMIQAQFPSIGLALVHKVIAFYRDNRDEMDVYIQQSRANLDQQAMVPQPGPNAAELQRRMEAHRPKESA